jgi:tetratricopeptide (TPR) repeat protein
MKSALLRCAVAAALVVLASCGATRVDLEAWRAEATPARAAEARGAPEVEFARVEDLRAARQLADARALALALAAEQPQSGHAAFLASRAESDALVLFADREKGVRNAAAASAADFAARAIELGEDSAAAHAQHAWALGASTHLQGMFDRAQHAHHTIAAAEAALALDPAQPTALATLAVVNLRLETLPWIANVMASGLPESSLDAAVDHARRAVAAEPSRENRLVLARCLRARGDEAGARAVVEEALAAAPRFPRDDELADDLAAELE